jgi:selenium metabolism protein YedF
MGYNEKQTNTRSGDMTTTVDARGLACPQPVILTRNAMRQESAITTLVSEREQVDNVLRLGQRAGWECRWEARADGFAVYLVRGDATSEPELAPDLLTCGVSSAGAVVALTSDRMGRGEDELGAILMRSFIYTLTQVEPLPKTLVLYNTGVRLAVAGSPVIDDLQRLAAAGVEILVCGTCLGYLGLKEQLELGTISNMYSIAEALLSSGNALTV